jgi:hypothetical protein
MRMISSISALDSPPPKVKVPVRCFQSSNDNSQSSRAMKASSAARD